MVPAIRAKGDVIGGESFADTGRDGFLTNREMNRTLDLVRPVDFGDLLLNPADAEH
jgi:hypothetical protein